MLRKASDVFRKGVRMSLKRQSSVPVPMGIAFPRALMLGCATAVLTACGGGGGGGPVSTPSPPPASPAPSPSPTPVPAPTPTPPPTFDTAEINRSDGPGQHNAVAAWQDGTTGDGEIIAIIDTGIDLDNPEFAGRIDRRSTYVAGTGDAQEVNDHGTHVALVAAGALDQTGVAGIAYDANILALRSDRPGSCTTGVEATLDGCRFADVDIANAVTRATNAGATVINLSLGGSNPGQRLNDAVAAAAAAGIVIVVSAGNDGGSTGANIDPANPDRFATGLLAAGGANVIIVGSVDAENEFSDFSNAAGDSAASFLSARGERVCCIYEDGVLRQTTRDGSTFVTLFSGTSFAAPQVAGAVALLAQAFPNLSGDQIVEILLETAAEAGAAGTDATYGRGLLDIAAAIAPQGTTRVAGTTTSLQSVDDFAIGSAAMGDALDSSTLQTIVLDDYDRAYGFQLGSRLRGSAPAPVLRGIVASNGRRVAAGAKKLSLAFTVGVPGSAGDRDALQPLRLSSAQAADARVLAGRLMVAAAPGTKLGFSFSERAEGLVAHLQGREAGHSRPAFMVARETAGDTGFAQAGKMAFAMRHQLGKLGLTVNGASGDAVLGASRSAVDSVSRQRERFGTSSLGFAMEGAIGPVQAIVGGTWLFEDRTVLGGYWHEAFGAGGADSVFLDGSLGFDFASGWRLGAAYRRGITRAQSGGLLDGGSRFSSNAFSMDLSKRHAFMRGDSLGLRIAQPLRVTGGGLDITLPTAYDYASESPVYGTQRISLTPEGRELMGELSWQGMLAGGAFSSSVFLRSQPGHYAQAPDDAGLVLRWNRQF